MQRISLWSGPRNVSTALMYSFAERSDTVVIDEPFYAHYLKVTGANHPGREEVLSDQAVDQEKIVEEILFAEYEKPVLFIKNMAHHLEGLGRDFLPRLTNIFLIRDPAEMLPSLIKKIPDPVMRDTAYEHQHELYRELRNRGENPLVIDSAELLKDPKYVLNKVCEKLDIPFEESMLSWEPGPRPEDGIWAQYWYRNVHRSSGFKPYEPKNEAVPDRLQPLLAECLRYYRMLYENAIKVN